MEDRLEALALEMDGLKSIIKDQKEMIQLQEAELKKKVENDPSVKPLVMMSSRRVERFRDKPEKSTDPSIREWVADMRSQADSRKLNAMEFASFLVDNIGGKARQEIVGRGDDIKGDPEKIIAVLLEVFGDGCTLPILQQRFYAYRQADEDLVACSLNMVELYDRIVALDASFKPCRDAALKGRLAEAVKDESLRCEIRRLNVERPEFTFFQLRDRAILWLGKITREKGVTVQEVSFNTTSELQNTLKRQQEMIEKQQRQIDALLNPPRNFPNREGKCYNCGATDHLKRQCPNPKKGGESGPQQNFQ